MLEGSSDILRNAADDHSLLVFDPQYPAARRTASSSSSRSRVESRTSAAAARKAPQLPRLLGACGARHRPRPRRSCRKTARKPRIDRARVCRLRRQFVAECAQNDRYSARRGAARRRHREEREAAHGRADRSPFGPVDRRHLHALSGVGRGNDRVLLTRIAPLPRGTADALQGGLGR